MRFTAAAALGCATVVLAVVVAPASKADDIAYLVNVTVRPGYHFANADEALDYGHGVCDKIARGEPYPRLIAGIESDFATADDYQAAYLVTQAANELCPALIWQLRNSAAGYVPAAPR